MRKMRDTRPNYADDAKAAIKATWASITPGQCHRLNGMKEWMKRICPCFTPSRIALTECAREIVAYIFRGFFLSHARDYDFDFYDYVERVTAHCIKIIDNSCFHNHWPAPKTKLNENLFESKGALRSLRVALDVRC